MDTGDFVVVINAGKVTLTGKKMKDKIYYHHTGYPGGIKEMNAEKLLAKKPAEMIRMAVRGCFRRIVWVVRCYGSSRSMQGRVIHTRHRSPCPLNWVRALPIGLT